MPESLSTLSQHCSDVDPRETVLVGRRRLPHVCFAAPNAYPILADRSELEFAGGAEVQQVLIARELVKRGYTVSMVCRDFGQPSPVRIDDIEVFVAFARDKGIPGLRFIWPRLWGIWRALRRANADVYYQRTAGFLTGIVALFCYIYGRKSIFAGASVPDFLRPTPRIGFWRDRWLYERGVIHVDKVLAQSEEQARLCHANYGRDAAVIPNCYPLPEIIDPDERDNYVLWVSMIRKLKRPGLFLDLAEALPEYRFVMIGGAARGEERLYDEVASRAGKLGNVDFVGFVPHSSVERYFKDAGVLVNTSESEGFPNTFLQAWAHQVPTVSFVDSSAGLANGKELGIRVERMRMTIEQVSRIMSDTSLRSSLGQTARTYVQETHAPDVVIGMYEALIRELASE